MPAPPTTPPRPRNSPFNMSNLQNSLMTPPMVKPDMGDMPTNIGREDVAQAMNSEMFLDDFGDFAKSYGPAVVLPADVTDCKKSMKDLLTKVNKVDRWRAYTTAPAKMDGHEDDIFIHLQQIFDAIAAFATSRNKKKNNFIFKLVPKKRIKGDISGSNHMMDACIVECTWTGKLPNNIIVVPMEFKSDNAQREQKDVREQIVGDCHHILNDDARRMFIYALTLENDRASVWYFSRTHSVKAQSFDWLGKDINKFIEIVLSFFYATPEALGIDPHVYKSPRKDGQYIYEFDQPDSAQPLDQSRQTRGASKANAAANKQYYLTQECYSPSRPACISGRVTRIWKAIEVRSAEDVTPVANASPVIIKDVWLHTDTYTEGENQDRIFAAVDSFVANGLNAAIDDYLAANPNHPRDDASRKALSSKQSMLEAFIDKEPRCAGLDNHAKKRLCELLTGQKYRSLFLTKLNHFRGQTSKKLSTAAYPPPNGLMFAVKQTQAKDLGQSHRTATSRTNPTLCRTGDYVASLNDQKFLADVQGQRLFEQKQQHRFVYKEVCEEVYKLKTVGDVMDIIRQTIDASMIMYCAKWIHRDLSVGNVLAFKVQKNGRVSYEVKVADLEFSQTMDHKKHKTDPRTGTPFFMACELMGRIYYVNHIGLRTRFPQDNNLATQLGIQEGDRLFDQLKLFPGHGVFSKYTPDNFPANATEDIPAPGAKAFPTYQHDLESIYWITLFVVTSLVGHIDSETYVRNIFKHSMDPHADRFRAIGNELPEDFDNCLLPAFRDNVVKFLESLRAKMWSKYLTMFAFGQLKVDEEYSEIYGHFFTCFRELMDDNGPWRQVPIVNRAAVEGMKIPATIQRGAKRSRAGGSTQAAKRSKK